jgi:hypothetical protein
MYINIKIDSFLVIIFQNFALKKCFLYILLFDLYKRYFIYISFL